MRTVIFASPYSLFEILFNPQVQFSDLDYYSSLDLLLNGLLVILSIYSISYLYFYIKAPPSNMKKIRSYRPIIIFLFVSTSILYVLVTITANIDDGIPLSESYPFISGLNNYQWTRSGLFIEFLSALQLLYYIVFIFPIYVMIENKYYKKADETHIVSSPYFTIFISVSILQCFLILIELIFNLLIFIKLSFMLSVFLVFGFYNHSYRAFSSENQSKKSIFFYRSWILIVFIVIVINIIYSFNAQRYTALKSTDNALRVLISEIVILLIIFISFLREKSLLMVILNADKLSVDNFFTIIEKNLTIHTFGKETVDFIVPIKFKSFFSRFIIDEIKFVSNHGFEYLSINPLRKISNKMIKNVPISKNSIFIELKIGKNLFKRQIQLNIIAKDTEEFKQLYSFLAEFHKNKQRYPLMSELYEADYSPSLLQWFIQFLKENNFEKKTDLSNLRLQFYDLNTLVIFPHRSLSKNAILESFIPPPNMALTDFVLTIRYMKTIYTAVKSFPYYDSKQIIYADLLLKQYILKTHSQQWNIFEFMVEMNLTFKTAYLISLLVKELFNPNFSVSKLKGADKSLFVLSKTTEKEIFNYIKSYQQEHLRNPTLYDILFQFHDISLVILIHYINYLNRYNLHQSSTPISTQIFTNIHIDDVIIPIVSEIDNIITYYEGNELKSKNFSILERCSRIFKRNRIDQVAHTEKNLQNLINEYINSNSNLNINISSDSELISSFGLSSFDTKFYDITGNPKNLQKKVEKSTKANNNEISEDSSKNTDMHDVLNELTDLFNSES